MRTFFDQKTLGFLHESIIGDAIPEGVVEISEELRLSLLDGERNGQVIKAKKNGDPYLEDAPPLTNEDKKLQAHNNRKAAYRAESDPLKVEADYDAIVSGNDPDYSAWMKKVEEIKARYPLPDQ